MSGSTHPPPRDFLDQKRTLSIINLVTQSALPDP